MLSNPSSRFVKPNNEGDIPPSNTACIPPSVFDKVTYNTHIAVIYVYRPPTLPNATVKQGINKALAKYREWTDRLGADKGDPLILLNDHGVNFVEASADSTRPCPSSHLQLCCLHPSLKEIEALLQVQFTRFTCGSLVVRFIAHHLVADGHSSLLGHRDETSSLAQPRHVCSSRPSFDRVRTQRCGVHEQGSSPSPTGRMAVRGLAKCSTVRERDNQRR
uniref:Uncharacterized protein n=1 Tax=Nelumbo nucifera TaxID=4432 RepID=A0A822YNX8_NELNU|nr:TPA_asm: hypothetical protein HUJ06_004950 [Nelumbo nucifera]